MEEIDRYKNKLKDLLGEDKLSRVIESLNRNIDRHADLHNEFIGLRSRYKRLEKEKRSGTLPSQEARQESNNIHQSLLGMINELAEEDMADFQTYKEKLELYERRIQAFDAKFSHLDKLVEKEVEKLLPKVLKTILGTVMEQAYNNSVGAVYAMKDEIIAELKKTEELSDELNSKDIKEKQVGMTSGQRLQRRLRQSQRKKDQKP